jgi:hypothetical protein
MDAYGCSLVAAMLGSIEESIGDDDAALSG